MVNSAVARFVGHGPRASILRRGSLRNLLARLGVAAALVLTALWNVALAWGAWHVLQAF